MNPLATLFVECARALLFAALALAAVAASLALAGCAGVHEARAVKGASAEKTRLPDGTEKLRVIQGENADSPTKIRDTADGLEISLGTAFAPSLAIPPPPDYTKYVALGLGAVMLCGGLVGANLGWPQMGATFALGGAGVIVLALTVGEHGWLWAAGAAGVCAVIALGQYFAWRKGYLTPNPAITDEQRRAAGVLKERSRA